MQVVERLFTDSGTSLCYISLFSESGCLDIDDSLVGQLTRGRAPDKPDEPPKSKLLFTGNGRIGSTLSNVEFSTVAPYVEVTSRMGFLKRAKKSDILLSLTPGGW